MYEIRVCMHYTCMCMHLSVCTYTFISIYMHTYRYIHVHMIAYLGNFGFLNFKKNVSYRSRHFSILLYGNFLLGMVKCVFVRLNYLK